MNRKVLLAMFPLHHCWEQALVVPCTPPQMAVFFFHVFKTGEEPFFVSLGSLPLILTSLGASQILLLFLHCTLASIFMPPPRVMDHYLQTPASMLQAFSPVVLSMCQPQCCLRDFVHAAHPHPAIAWKAPHSDTLLSLHSCPCPHVTFYRPCLISVCDRARAPLCSLLHLVPTTVPDTKQAQRNIP